MPELPEVETVRLQLLRKVVGKTIAAVEVFHQKTSGYDSTFAQRLAGKTIEHIDRIGKLLIVSFTGEHDLFLLAHLKMTGQFFYTDALNIVTGGGHSMTLADIRELPGKHTRIGFTFTDASHLYFNDMRLFGYTKLANHNTVAAARAGFGPEPIDHDFATAPFITALKKKRTVIKAALLDQSFIAGLGNIYVDEALWRAGVSPLRPSNLVTEAEALRIAGSAGDVMREAILKGGTTFQHFADTGGENGNFTDHLKVFGKQGTPCPRCGTTIKKIRAAGRGTHYCPHCQT